MNIVSGILLVGFGILTIGGVFWYIAWQRDSKRIEKLRSVIWAVSKGDTNKRAQDDSDDAIGQLAQDLNGMIVRLMEARQLPENILRSMRDGLLVVDKEGKITQVNQAVENMLGYKAQELVGKPISTVFENKHKNHS